MKEIKFILLAYLIFHFASVSLVNLMALTKFKDNNERINKFGNAFVQIIERPDFIEQVESSLGLYVNLTGVNRGYEFFSPNVFKGKIDLVFESDSGEKIDLFKSQEAKMKFFTFSLYFNSNLKDKKRRDDILKSVCSRLFSKNVDLNEVYVYADVQLYDPLTIASPDGYVDNKGKILLSKITKSNHEKSSSQSI